VSGSQKLVLLDMDSTFIQQEVIDLLAFRAGVGVQVAAITELSMRGEIDFKESLSRRVSLLKGLPEAICTEVRSEITLSKGAREMISGVHARGDVVAIVSGGFENVIAPILISEKVDSFKANTLEIEDGFLTGRTIGPVIDRAAKAEYLRELSLTLDILLQNTIAVGDGANDLGMMEIAGMSVAFNAKPIVRERASHQINDGDLSHILSLIY
jgi:phosphoserine phosphatase